MEESMRFELMDVLPPLVFKTSALDRSANFPIDNVLILGEF
jgi:hypothetical protein